MSGTRDALLVGCCHYEDLEFQQLQAPAQDVDALTRVLADPTIGNFTVQPPLLNEPSQTVREQVEGFFANRKPDDLLLLYFSCHGELDPRGRLYFVAANTKKERPDATGITARWVKERMDESRSQRIVLLLDCCYSGAFAARGRADGNEIVEQQLGGRGRVVITASGRREHAHESIFTNAVVEGLETGAADLNEDGQVSVTELYQYVCDRVRENEPNQTPTMSADGMGGQLHLANNPHALPLPAELEQALTSEIVRNRLWAVEGLRLLLAGDHPAGQQRRAKQALVRLGEDDTDPGVRAAASKALRRASDRNLWLVGGGLVLAAVLGGVAGWGLKGLAAAQSRSSIVPPPSLCSPSVKPADGVLSLGTLFPKTGAFVYTGPPLDAGVRLAMKDINDAGGIPGVAVTLDAVNQRDEGNPSAATARQSTDALLAGEVDAIIGPGASAAALNVIEEVVCEGVIMFSPGTTSPVFTTYLDHGFYFRTALSDALAGIVLGKLVVDDRNSTVVVMASDDAYGNPLREATEKAIRESGGQVLDSISYDPNAREYDKDIQRIKTKNPDAIVLIGFTESAQILAKMIEGGIDPKGKRVYGSDSNMTNTLAGQVNPQDPGVLEGMKGILPDTGSEAFVKRLREISPGLRDLTYAAHAYDAVVITALAAAVAGTDSPAAIAQEINGVTKAGEKCTSFAACMALVKDRKDIDYDGSSGPLEFTDSGEPCSGAYVISEIQADGTIRPLRSERVDC